jgi:16S rRNA G527 N7-methylase RsmG
VLSIAHFVLIESHQSSASFLNESDKSLARTAVQTLKAELEGTSSPAKSKILPLRQRSLSCKASHLEP